MKEEDVGGSERPKLLQFNSFYFIDPCPLPSSRLCGCWLRLNYCYKAMIISLCLGTLMLSLFGLYFGMVNPKMRRVTRVQGANDSLLIPPNPEVPQPPSPSVLHVFSNAAVCSDSDVCSRIGRWVGGGVYWEEDPLLWLLINYVTWNKPHKC